MGNRESKAGSIFFFPYGGDERKIRFIFLARKYRQLRVSCLEIGVIENVRSNTSISRLKNVRRPRVPSALLRLLGGKGR